MPLLPGRPAAGDGLVSRRRAVRYGAADERGQVLAVARRKFEADLAADPSIAERQERAAARNRERLRRLRRRGR